MDGNKLQLQTDQQPLVYLRNMKNRNGRLMRWSLTFQSYSFDIEFIKDCVDIGAAILFSGNK